MHAEKVRLKLRMGALSKADVLAVEHALRMQLAWPK